MISRGLVASVQALAMGVACAIAFHRAGSPQHPDLTGVWSLEMRAIGNATDTTTRQGRLALVAYGSDSAAWSFNVSKPDYVGAYVFTAPRAPYVPRASSAFPAVAVQWTGGDSV